LPIKIGKLSLGTAAELSKASELVTQKVAEGRLTPGQGQAFAELLGQHRKIIETDDLDRRLQALEGKQ
jgi:polyhydroxyalkanoate synthesis regulator phasin